MTEVLDATSTNVQRAAECIREGGVVVAPSDTNVALTVDPSNAEAIDRAYEAKDRPVHKPLTLFVREPGDWRQFGSHEDADVVDRLVERFWPGPLNLVLEQTDQILDERLYMDDTVSIGCLSNPVWRELADNVGGPVAMTSANRSGTVADDTLVDVDLAIEHVGDDVDLIVDGGPQGTTRASTILSLAAGDPGEAEILRQGDVSRNAIRDATQLVVG